MQASELVTKERVEKVAKAFADAAGYYVEFHRGLSSPSADKIRAGARAALEAVTLDLYERGLREAIHALERTAAEFEDIASKWDAGEAKSALLGTARAYRATAADLGAKLRAPT